MSVNCPTSSCCRRPGRRARRSCPTSRSARSRDGGRAYRPSRHTPYAQTGAVVIHLTAISTFTLDGETGKKYATVAWIDQYATDPFVNYADPLVRRYQEIQIQFADPDVVQGSLSPTVTPISGTDANGYQATDPPVWDDPLAYAAGTRVLSFFDSRFDVEFADPLTCPAPLLIFSDDDSPTIVDLG